MRLFQHNSIKSLWLCMLLGCLFIGLNPSAVLANSTVEKTEESDSDKHLTIINDGNCAVNIYHWLPDGDVYFTTIQPGGDWTVTTQEGEKWRAVDTDNVWQNLLFDQHYMLNGNTNQSWRITPNYCNGGSNGCDGQITDFQLNRQDGSALIALADGVTFCESDFTGDVKVRALVSGTHESLLFTIIGPNGTETKVENYETYDTGQFWLSPGQYTVKAELFRDPDLGGDICDTKMISFTVNDCNGIPALDCEDGDFVFEGTQRLIYSSLTLESFDLPAAFLNADFVKISEVIASDSYANRVNRDQANEQLRLVFLKDGTVTGQSAYTPDLEDLVETAYFQGTLPNVTLTDGADELLVVHPGNDVYGENITNSPNSLDLRGLCLMAGVNFDPCANGAPVATVVKNDPTCGNIDGKFTFSFDDNAGRTNIEFSIDGGNTYPHNVSDNVGSTMIAGLGNGSYDLYVRWGNDECPVSLGTFELTDGSQAPGTSCNDQNANTENDVILADGCTCEGTAIPPVVIIDGGTLQGGPFHFCVDGTPDNIPADGITLVGGSGPNRGWVVTDDAGNILGLPPTFTAPDFDAAGVGTCFVYYIAYEDGLSGLEGGNNLSDLAGNYDLSNGIEVVRSQPDGGSLDGGPFEFCVSDGDADFIPAGAITVTPGTGTNATMVITDADGTILGLPPTVAAIYANVDFDGAGAGTCIIYRLAYEDVSGLEMNANVNDLEGCFDLSNGIQVVREVCTTPLLPNILIDDVVVNEADGTASLTVAIDVVSATDVVVDFATNDGTAIAGVDYAALAGSITIPAGQQFVTITFDILEDTIDEADELFTVLLSNPQGAIIVGALGSVTILDNDDPVVGGCNATYSVDGNVITVSNITGAIRGVKVVDESWNTVFSCDEWTNPCGGSESITIATCGKYYVQIQTYADWSTPICNVFEAVQITDGCGTGVDCPGLGLNFGDACNDGNPNTINDVVAADCGCYGTPVGPQYDCPSLSANIGDACDDFNPNTSNDVVQANCSCAGTAQPQDCNVTYSVDGKTVTVSNLSGAIKIVKIVDQNWNALFSCDDWTAPCGDEVTYTLDDCGSYFLQVQTYVDWNTPICNLFETIEINDDCGNGSLPLITIGDVEVIEDAGLVRVPVCINEVSTEVVTVEYGTNNGTALLNQDYTANTATIVIQPGDLCGFAEVFIDEDLTVEPNEFLTIDLSNPTGATIEDGQGVVTIIDNDDDTPVYDCPALSANIGDACDDGNADTTNDHVQADCSCAGTPVGPIYDCPALSANIGDTCDDGNANTNNDLVQADCSCAGTPMNNPSCQAAYSVDGRTISVSNITGAITTVKVIDSEWAVLFECSDWGVPCDEAFDVEVPECGTYFVQIQTYADWSTVICNLFETVVIDSDCGIISGCDNVTDGGSIAGDESGVAGYDPAPITSADLPTGGSGTIEYQWLSSTTGCPRFATDFIAGANESTYDPGPITETTYFVRCARRAGCDETGSWTFGESNCVVKTVNAGSPDICAEREAINTRTCSTDVPYGIWLQGQPYTIRDGKFVEFTDGTARFTAEADGIGAVDVLFTGRVFVQDSVKFGSCLGTTPTDDWYFYSDFTGTIGSHSISLRGPIFQIGTGANAQQADEFGGAAWFSTHDGLVGDINFQLTGDPGACQIVQARSSSIINSFDAELNQGKVELTWANNTGSINDYFELERSIDGIDFESIGTIETQSLDDTPTFYDRVDGAPLKGFNYYRLKLTYLDGTSEYSEIRQVKISDIEEFGLFPNPAQEVINVSLRGYEGKNLQIQLVTQFGQMVKSVDLNNVSDASYSIGLDKVKNGIYTLWIFTEGGGKPVGKKMIVNKMY